MKKDSNIKKVLTIFIPIIVLIIPLLIVNPASAEEGEIWINVTKEINPIVIHPCEPATIFINVTAEGDPIIELPVAVMIVIDVSGSMGWEYENETGFLHPALYYVKNAANTFIDNMDLTNDTVGVVSFSTIGALNQSLTHDGDDAKYAINDLNASGWTNTGEGISIAHLELIENAPSDAFPIILLFTDGLPTAHGTSGNNCENNCPTENNTCTDYACDKANISKYENTTIFSIGFTGAILNNGCTNDTVSFAEWLLKDIASNDDYFYAAPNAVDLEQIYLNISQIIYDVQIKNLTIFDFLPSHFNVTDDGGGKHVVLANGTHKIEFIQPLLSLNDSWNIEFKVTSNVLGDLLPTNLAYSNITYIQNNVTYIENLSYPINISISNPLELEKTAPSGINQGEQLTYDINITNIGHMVLDNVTIHEPLSNKVTFNSINSNYSGFNEDNWEYIDNTLNITNIVLDIGDKIGFKIFANVIDDATGVIKNTAYCGYSTSTGCSVEDICNVSTTTLINEPPNKPINPNPNDKEANVELDDVLSWTCSDPDGDPLTYDVYFGTSNPPSLKVQNQTVANYNPNLGYLTTYYWKIIAWDDHNNSNESKIWKFTTRRRPGGGSPPSNLNPVADASAGEPYFGFVDENITFDGSNSYDQDLDGYLTKWEWDFDDGTEGIGEIITHNFSESGIYDVTLTVTDNFLATNDVTFEVTISSGNYPPHNLVVDGPLSVEKDMEYSYTANATDPDDMIRYIFNWGDETNTTSDFVTSGTPVTLSHSWSSGGLFEINVTVEDNSSAQISTSLIVLVDTIMIDDMIKGYLVDENNDEKFDKFINTETGEETVVELDNETYLIDSDGNTKWDHAYNEDTGMSTFFDHVLQKYQNIFQEEYSTPGFELISVLAMMAVVFLILRRKR